MLTSDQASYYNAEVKHCAECLYTLAGVVNSKRELTNTWDMTGNYSGYDVDYMRKLADDAQNMMLLLFVPKNKVRKMLRDAAQRVTAEAAVKRGYMVDPMLFEN